MPPWKVGEALKKAWRDPEVWLTQVTVPSADQGRASRDGVLRVPGAEERRDPFIGVQIGEPVAVCKGRRLDLRGAVCAGVVDHDDAVRPTRQRLQGGLDPLRLVVRHDARRDPASAVGRRQGLAPGLAAGGGRRHRLRRTAPGCRHEKVVGVGADVRLRQPPLAALPRHGADEVQHLANRARYRFGRPELAALAALVPELCAGENQCEADRNAGTKPRIPSRCRPHRS